MTEVCKLVCDFSWHERGKKPRVVWVVYNDSWKRQWDEHDDPHEPIVKHACLHCGFNLVNLLNMLRIRHLVVGPLSHVTEMGRIEIRG